MIFLLTMTIPTYSFLCINVYILKIMDNGLGVLVIYTLQDIEN